MTTRIPNPAPAAESQLDDWLAIESDGNITVYSGKVELGTGVRTALAQIVAEELDVPLARIHMVMGHTGRTPDEGTTAGSKTIQRSGANLRNAAAEARLALLELASDRLDAALDELVIDDGVISTRPGPQRSVSYADLMGGRRFNRPVSGQAPTKPPASYRIVGQPLSRVDIPGKVTAQPSFVHDLRLPGMLHGRVVRPPTPGATLLSLDESSVLGVRVVRLENFVGVVAEREEAAIAAARDLKATWSLPPDLPAMADLFDHIQQQPTQEQVVAEAGDVEAALAQAPTRLEATFYQPFHAHASIGPSCAVADYRDDRLTVWCSSQGVFALRGALAEMLGLPVEQVEAIHMEGAGCYGHNGFDDVAADAALLSRAVGQPVRLQWSRADEFGWEPKSPAMVMALRGGLDAGGRVAAWAYDVWSPPHGRRPRAGKDLLTAQLASGRPVVQRGGFGGGDRNAPTNYNFTDQQVTMHWLAESVIRTSSMRGLGAPANTFANESFMDELAEAAGVDPLDFRLRHLDDPRAVDVVKAAAEAADWGSPLEPNQGRGLAFARYETNTAYVAAVAEVTVEPDSGQIRVPRIVVAHDCGLIINPDGLRNQIEGNIVQSLSRALKEEVTFDRQGITSLNWQTYPILKFSEMPEIEIILINRPDQPAVGAGEPATVVTAPAVANGVYQAVGVRLRQVPFTPARVLAGRSRIA